MSRLRGSRERGPEASGGVLEFSRSALVLILGGGSLFVFSVSAVGI